MSVSVPDLRDVLRADFATGRLFWLPRPREGFSSYRAFRAFEGRFAGREALCTLSRERGYMVGAFRGRMLRRCRVIWALANGRWPKADIDHINGNRTDDWLENLREATRSENLGNSRCRSGSFKGVSLDGRKGRWVAQITKDYKHMHLGAFDTEVDAALAYDEAARRLFGDFARCNFEPALEARIAACPRA